MERTLTINDHNDMSEEQIAGILFGAGIEVVNWHKEDLEDWR